MYNDKIITFDNMWQRRYPLSMNINISTLTSIFWNYFFYPILPTLGDSLKSMQLRVIKKCKIFMIPRHAPCIRTVADILNYFIRLRSLVDEVSDEVDIILILHTCIRNKCYEFIITTMYISDEKCSLWHGKDYTIKPSISNLFFGPPRNKNTGLFFILFPLWSSLISSLLERYTRDEEEETCDGYPTYESKI